MKANRLGSLLLIAIALTLLLGQGLSSGAKAAPHYQVNATVHADQASPAKGESPASQSPYHITVQGRLTDAAGNPITVATNVTFNLYDAPSGGSPLFTEGPISVTPDSRGLFTYQLGTNNNINLAVAQAFANKVYLGITIAADAEMPPRFELTASPYAMSLSVGAVISGTYTSQVGRQGVVNAINNNRDSEANTGLYAEGATAVRGMASSTGSSSGYGAFFRNDGGGSGSQIGLEAVNYTGNLNSSGYAGYFYNGGGGNNSTSLQVGVYAYDNGAGSGEHYAIKGYNAGTGSGPQYGIAVFNGASTGYGGVFTATTKGVIGDAGTNVPSYSPYNDGVTGLTSATSGSGVYGHATGANGEGVWGTAQGSTASAIGGWFDSYDLSSSHTAIYARGSGHASGGWVTPNGFSMMVKYNGADELHPGDILALDGDNTELEGMPLLGAVKADASNVAAAVGIAQYRYQLYPGDKANDKGETIQVDDGAASFKSGDLIQIMVVGQAEVKVSGTVHIGDCLSISPAGSIVVTKVATESIGKVAGKPDKDGLVRVFVNFK